MTTATIPPASAHPTRAGAVGATHPRTNQGPPVLTPLARIARRWANTHLADTNRRLTDERSYLASEVERITRERDDAHAELEQWRNGNPRHIALTSGRRHP